MRQVRASRAETDVCGAAFEEEARRAGARLIAGVDEVTRRHLGRARRRGGRDPGPGAASRDGVNDFEKQLARSERERLDDRSATAALAYAVARVRGRRDRPRSTSSQANQGGHAAGPSPRSRPRRIFLVLVDAVELRATCGLTDSAPSHAATRSRVSIAAASIVAKVARDAWMRDYDTRLPGYGFASHVGYGTPAHLRSLRALGPSPIHRLTFRRVLPDPALFER